MWSGFWNFLLLTFWGFDVSMWAPEGACLNPRAKVFVYSPFVVSFIPCLWMSEWTCNGNSLNAILKMGPSSVPTSWGRVDTDRICGIVSNKTRQLCERDKGPLRYWDGTTVRDSSLLTNTAQRERMHQVLWVDCGPYRLTIVPGTFQQAGHRLSSGGLSSKACFLLRCHFLASWVRVWFIAFSCLQSHKALFVFSPSLWVLSSPLHYALSSFAGQTRGH